MLWTKHHFSRLKKQSILYQWMLAYSLVLMILLASGIFLNHISVNAIKKETVDSKKYFLMAVNNEITSVLEQAQQMYNTIYFNRYFSSLRDTPSLSADAQYAIYSFNNELKASGLNTSGLKYIIYYPKLDIILSEHGSLDSRTYYDFYVQDQGLNYESYCALLQNESQDRFFLVSDGRYQAICYTRSSSAIGSRDKANIIILLPEEQIRIMLDRYFSYNINAIAIKDKQKNTLLLHNLTDQTVIQEFLSNEQEGSLFELHDHNDLIAAYRGPLMQGWECYLFSYASDFWYQSMAINRLSMVVIFTGVFLCILGISVSLYRSYTPVRMLVGKVHDIVPSTQEMANEYQAFEQALTYMHDESREKNQIIQIAHERLLEELVLRVLHGQADDEDVERFCIFFQEEYFVHGAVQYSSFPDMERLHQEFIKEVCSGVLAGRFLGIRDGKGAVLLLNLPEGNREEEIEAFISAMTQAMETLKVRYGADCIMTVDSTPVTYDCLNASYRQTVKALEYKKLMNTDEIVANQLLASFSNRAYYFPLNIEYELSRQIHQGNFEEAKKQLEILFHINFYQEPLHLYMTRCLLYDIIGTLVKALDAGSTQEIRMLENIDIDLKSNDEASLLRVQSEIEGAMQLICEQYSREGNKPAAVSKTKLDLTEQVKAYIEDNLGSLALSQESIAVDFGISVSQLFRIFKEVEGLSIVEYIHRLRIAKSKELLSSTEKTIDEIALECGYSGSKTLTRLYKKYEGITPGIWRKFNQASP